MGMAESIAPIPERVSDADVARFSDAWDALLVAVRRAQARGARAGEDLSLSQYQLLAPLTDGRQPVGRLAAGAGISAPTATRVLDGLERSGAVLRERCLEDRREVLVSLTDAGRERLAAKHAQLEARRHHLYERLDPDERPQSTRLLHHLAELLGEL